MKIDIDRQDLARVWPELAVPAWVVRAFVAGCALFAGWIAAVGAASSWTSGCLLIAVGAGLATVVKPGSVAPLVTIGALIAPWLLADDVSLLLAVMTMGPLLGVHLGSALTALGPWDMSLRLSALLPTAARVAAAWAVTGGAALAAHWGESSPIARGVPGYLLAIAAAVLVVLVAVGLALVARKAPRHST